MPRRNSESSKRGIVATVPAQRSGAFPIASKP
jgi:hypothetical protein